jgi:carbon-monoxide dehydrogenase medium subunit
MNGFDFIRAADLQDAMAILARENEHACLVAGATNVTVKAKAGRLKDKLLVSIDGLDELRGIREEAGYLYIGALTCISTISKSQMIKEKGHILWQAAQVFADPVIRNSATIGGNIADASPTADSAPPLLALKADLIISSVRGERILPIEQFFFSVCQTALQSDEIITAIRFKPSSKGVFVKLGLREAMAKTLISAAAILNLDDEGNVADCTIALGSVAPRPIRAYNAEKALIGKQLNGDTLTQMKEAVKADISPIESIRASIFYRTNVCCTLVERAVKKAV